MEDFRAAMQIVFLLAYGAATGIQIKSPQLRAWNKSAGAFSVAPA